MHAFYGQRPGGSALAASKHSNQSQGGTPVLKVNSQVEPQSNQQFK